jgi:hypothetical protein
MTLWAEAMVARQWKQRKNLFKNYTIPQVVNPLTIYPFQSNHCLCPKGPVAVSIIISILIEIEKVVMIASGLPKASAFG